jgi:integrase
MARTPKPWFREDRQAWFVTIRGERHNLGADKDEAHRLFHEMLGKKADEPKPVAAPTSPLVAVLIDGFLEWCQSHRAHETYLWYQKHLQSFLESLPKPASFTAADLKPFHVQQWVDKHAGWGPSYRRGAMIAVQRCMTWAEKLGHIDRTPLKHLEKPPQGKREKVVSAETFEKMLARVRKNTRDLLNFSWHSGARPQETRIIEARHFSKERQRLEMPPAEAKGKKRWRIICLTPEAAEIVERLAAKWPEGPIFRNEDGKQWTPFAINCVFSRLKAKLGGIKYSLYTLRHSFCQRLLEAGVDTVTVAALMGHSNAVMVSTTYSHMGQATAYLAEQLKKANGRASTEEE